MTSADADDAGVFLTGEWRYLLMLQYPAEPALLKPYLPAGVELDFWNGLTFVSMVGFQFLKTRLLGVPIPFHQNFDEVNLRFYVRRRTADGWRRGVVFIKEIVPRWAIAAVARLVYNERYVTAAMRHRLDLDGAALQAGGTIEYDWGAGDKWRRMKGRLGKAAVSAAAGSLDEFITENYYGYSAQRDGGCLEYRLEHRRWNLWPVAESALEGDMAACYGEQLAAVLSRAPESAFVADGSAVAVRRGVRIPKS